MGFDIDKILYTDIIKNVEKDEKEFKNLDLEKTIKEIYDSSLQKASDNYIIEIEKNRKHFLEITYNTEQAQEKFNVYTNNIRLDFENDTCTYNLIKKEVNKTMSDESLEAKQHIIMSMICFHINEEINSYYHKLQFIKNLPQQIYESNKTHRQFLFFKQLAKDNNPTTNKPEKESKEKLSLKAIFKNDENYNTIIHLLETHKFISQSTDNIFEWHGDNSQPSLRELKLLGTLAYVLKSKNYYHTNTPKKDIAEAFRNTFPNSTLSDAYYGKVESQLANALSYTKESEYLKTYHFIKSL
jgi:hypothetical protein